MKFLEKTLVILAIIGLFVRVMMWQGGELFLTVALPSLAVMYLLASWSVFKHHQQGHHLFLSILSGLTFSVVFIGILFKLMIWRGGNIFLITGLSAMAVSKILGLILENRLVRELNSYFRRLFLRYYIIAAAGLIMLLTPYKFIVSVYHRDDPEYVRLFVRYVEEPNNMEYRAEFLQHRRKKFKEQWDVKEYKD
jgi:hypothetical protein